MRKDNKTKEDAVSPVIGVMLMLVVTVVIAAVVVVFSTGLAGSTATTPSALLEVEYIQMSDMGEYLPAFNGQMANFGIKHKGGDPIPLKDIQITIEQRGGTDGHIQIVKATDSVEEKINPMFDDMTKYDGHALPLSVLGKGGDVGDEEPYSGVNFETGDVLRVVYWDGVDGAARLMSGTIIKWTISYIPTTSIISKGEFEVP